MLAMPPDCVRWITRNGEDNDCAIAAISLATGHSYETVLGHAMAVHPGATVDGLTMRQIKAVLLALDVPHRVRRKFDIEEDTGILWVSGKSDEHVVYLWEGRVIEPSLGRRSLWLDPRGYLAHEKYLKATWLIEVVTKQGE